MGKKYGYARVSTNDQKTDVQVGQLVAAGVAKKNIFRENVSGKNVVDRHQLQALLKTLSDGDTLVVTKIDRLGRSVIDVLVIIDKLHERGIFFQSLDLGIDTSTHMGRFALTIMAGVAELERARIRERQRDGIDAIMNGPEEIRRAKYPGRAPVYLAYVDAVRNLVKSGVPKRQIAKMLGISRSTVYKCLEAGG